MNSLQCQCFCTVAETMNFTQAAQKMFVTQPAISRLISSLEKEVGVKLLNRDTRHVSLTPAGEAFYHSCKKILENYDEGMVAAQLAEQGMLGRLRIGFLRDTLDDDLAWYLLNYRKQYPDVRIEMKGYSHTELINAVLNGEVDIASGGRIDSSSIEFQSIRIRKLREMAVLPHNHPLAQRESLYLHELQKEDFILMSRASSSPGHDFLTRITKDAGFIPNVVAYASYLPELLTMVASGLGVSVLSGNLEEIAKRSCAMVPLELTQPTWRRLCWLPDNGNPCLARFIDMVRASPNIQ